MAPRRLERGRELLYLSRADVVACALAPAEINAAIEAGFAEKAAGRAFTSRGAQMAVAGGASYDAKAGARGGHAGVKWYGYYPDNDRLGLPHFLPVILLSETESGMPVAVMDGTWVTEARTAAITAVAAGHLARRDARRLGFVACGAQARSHLEALRASFPLASVVAYSRRRETAEAFAALARAKGLEARSVAEPREAVADVDIVVTSVPHRARREVLDAGWTAPGTFVSMVDLGFSWRRETLPAFDRVVTDDLDQGTGAHGLNFGKPIETDLAALVAGKGPRPAPTDRVALMFAGTGLADVVVAGLVFARARDRNIGRVLPL